MKFSKINYFLIAGNRCWALTVNLVVAYIVSTHLSKSEQGSYYAYQSLGAAQFFFDLGIGFVLANLAGRRVAKAQMENCSGIEELSSVMWFSIRWSFIAALVLVVALFFTGKYMFPSEDRLAWNFYSALIGVNMVIAANLSILEGVGRVLAVSIIRSIQSVIFVVIFYSGVVQGFGLLALPLALAGSTLPAIFWLIWSIFPSTLFKFNLNKDIYWRRDIYPLQWRVAISWVSGYFVFQAPVPFLYKVVGPVEAGQLGLTMQIFQALTSLASIFLSTRVKAWSHLAVHERYEELKSDLWHVVGRCILSVLIGAGVLIALRWVLSHVSPMHADRVVDSKIWFFFTAAAVANQLFFSFNYYFRAQGQEPLWTIALVAALISIIAAWITLPVVSIFIVTLIYFFVSVVIHAGGSVVAYKVHAQS